MIKLTGEKGESIYISPEQTAYMKLTTQGHTGINVSDGYVIVTESLGEVARKLLEYKVATTPVEMNQLYRLAGLEVNPKL